MAFLTWNSKYSVGVPSMDSQHTVLFGILNDLHAAMLSDQAQSAIGDVLRNLVNYTREHFSAEEALMTAAGYPELERHRLQHRNLVMQVDDFVVRYQRGEAHLTLPLLNFLRDWLSNHIQQEDKLYGPAPSQGIAD
jgi:hemerythrin